MINVPSVIRRTGGRYAIVISKGRSLYEVVEMSNRTLLVKKYGDMELKLRGFESTDLDPVETAKRYLEHQAGVSPNAREALTRLIDNAYLL